MILLLLLILTSAAFLSCRKMQQRQMSERITLRQKDKIPYGTAAARQLLPSLFPGTNFYDDDNSPGDWMPLNTSLRNQAVVLVANNFDADYDELRRLQYFASQGNYVFIIAKSFSDEATRFFNFSYYGHNFDMYVNSLNDSLLVRLEKPAYPSTQVFTYPGKKFASYFSSVDVSHSAVLGTDGLNRPNFLEYRSGTGRIFIHSAPLAFSNYFLLHKNNSDYFQQAFSVMPRSIKDFVWNEYYLTKPSSKTDEDDQEVAWYRVLFRYPPFKWGLLVGLFMLILYTLLNSRRRQRKIPFYSRPQNDSLDFVKTLGRLYHDRRDHQNLARKMSLYFLEHVRSTFKLPTHTLDESFIRALQYKSGYPAEDLNQIFSFISYINQNGAVNEQQLSRFHKQLETFYQKT